MERQIESTSQNAYSTANNLPAFLWPSQLSVTFTNHTDRQQTSRERVQIDLESSN